MSGTQIKLGSTLMDVIPPKSDEFQLRKLLYHRLKRKRKIQYYVIYIKTGAFRSQGNVLGSNIEYLQGEAKRLLQEFDSFHPV